MKYVDPDAGRRKHLAVIITANVRTKRMIGIEPTLKAQAHGNRRLHPETWEGYNERSKGEGILW